MIPSLMAANHRLLLQLKAAMTTWTQKNVMKSCLEKHCITQKARLNLISSPSFSVWRYQLYQGVLGELQCFPQATRDVVLFDNENDIGITDDGHKS
jgi:hypothetical protein